MTLKKYHVSQPKLLILGGTGFIGRKVANRAVQLGWRTICLGLSGRSVDGAICFAADISQPEDLLRTIRHEKFNYVINCGGYISHTSFGGGGREILRVHFDGLLNLVEMLDRSELRHFINIGSSDEYGGSLAPQKEDMRENPISPYSLGKTAATHFLQMMHRTVSFPATTLRLFLTYGPGQDKNRLLPQIINACIENVNFPVSKGDQLRDFCYVDDVVDAIYATLDNVGSYGEVINIASGESIAIREVVEKVCQILGTGSPQFGLLPYRPAENMSLYADISKAAKILNWHPKVTFADGLIRTIEWIKKNDANGISNY